MRHLVSDEYYLLVPPMNNYCKSNKKELVFPSDPAERVSELERELLKESSRPVIAAILVTFLVVGVLILGIVAYKFMDSGNAITAHGQSLIEDVEHVSLQKAAIGRSSPDVIHGGCAFKAVKPQFS